MGIVLRTRARRAAVLGGAIALSAVSLCPLASAGSRAHAAKTSPGGPGPNEFGCPILPADNPLNQEVAALPVSPDSAQYVESIGLSAHLHPDFERKKSSGIPYKVVSSRQPPVPVDFTEDPEESDPGPYPIPPKAPVEGAGEEGDRHVLVLQRGTCKLYEMFGAERVGEGWDAASGAVFDLRSDALRPEGFTSADAAGLPIFPLLVRYPEVKAGAIEHALRVTVPRSQRGYIHPATHFASRSSDPALPPMGLRLRLKADYSLEGFSGQALVIAQALKRYGLIVADNGSPWYITGAPSGKWDEASLAQLKSVPGSAFEAVQSGPIIH